MRVASLPGIVVFKVALQSAIACRVNIRFPLVDNAMPPGNGARQNDFSVSAWNNAYTPMQCVLATYLWGRRLVRHSQVESQPSITAKPVFVCLFYKRRIAMHVH